MSEMTTNAASDDTLIRDSQVTGFSAFKEHLAFCCCRLFKKTSTYDLSSASKDFDDKQEKPSYINRAYQAEKQARNDKLEKIAKTLPGGTQGIRTPNSTIQTLTNVTPRSGITLRQTRPTTKPIITKPSPLATNKKIADETNTDDSSEEESSSDSDKSSDSDNAPKKRVPVKNANNRR